MTRRTYNSINTVKLLFIYVVLIFHSRLLDGIVNHGYIGVELFFIVSGFFLCQTYSNYSSVFEYAKNRLNKLYPHYFFSLVVMLVVSLLTGRYWKENFDVFAEIFLLQNLGFTYGGVNYPCWYMSVLFWISLLVFQLLTWVSQKMVALIGVVLPACYFVYSILFHDGRTEIWYTDHGIYLPVIRGLAFIMLGVTVQVVHQAIIDINLYRFEKLWRLCEIGTFCGIIILILYPGNLDFLTVILMCVFLIAATSPNALFEKIGQMGFIKWLAKYEYAIYLNHATVIVLFNTYFKDNVEWRVSTYLFALLVVITAYSLLTSHLISQLRNCVFWRSLRHKLSKQ